jgi:hypothetical protein
LDRRLGGRQSRSGHGGEEKEFLLCLPFGLIPIGAYHFVRDPTSVGPSKQPAAHFVHAEVPVTNNADDDDDIAPFLNLGGKD